MRHKLSVFIGSPKRHLERVREAIIQAILEAGHIPDGMELWASDARPTLKTIGDKLRLCDVHVVVLSQSYGQTLEKAEISFVEWEYIQSRDAKRPIISFLLEEAAIETLWNDNPPKDEKEKKDRDAYRKLWNELRRNSVCKLYKSVEMDHIDRDVLNALNQVIDSEQLRPLAGWIRAESKAAKLASTLQGNPFLMRIMDRVVRFRTTGDRFDKERNAKKAAAQLFWDTMLNRLARAEYTSIFLESGSSLAYVSEDLESKLVRQEGWKIATNNTLSLLQLLLFTDGEIRRNPAIAPDPDDPYGAIFTLKCRQAYEDPPIKPRPLYPKEKDAIDELIQLLKSEGGKQIILATASGWDSKHDIIGFHGPHVGSHPNMLVKRAIFMTGEPVVLFLSRHKVDSDFSEARFKCRIDYSEQEAGTRFCYPVFGIELPLEKALIDIPLAICIGYELEKTNVNESILTVGKDLESLLKHNLGLNEASFDFQYSAKAFQWEDGSQAGAIMIANEKFRQKFDL